MNPDFYLGCFTGFFFATFLGIVFRQIQETRKKVGAHKKPQPVIGLTKKTPVEVVSEHRTATLQITGLVIAAIAVSVLLMFIIFRF